MTVRVFRMPASASASASSDRPEDLITRLSSATDDGEAKLKALRELKNQIIGSRTKKLSYIKLGAVPSVVSILADGSSNSLLVQSAAAIGSFACGFDAGVKAVLDAGAFPHLFSLISHSNDKGMYVLSNVASGNEFHKEAVMQQLFPQMGNDTQSIMIKLLQSNDGQLRMAAVWVVVNLTFPSSPSAYDQVVKLRNGSVISQLKNMVNDPCLDVKALRVRTVMGQFMTFGDGST